MEYVKTDFAPDDGDDPYLTPNKVYNLSSRGMNNDGRITADDGGRIYILLDGCAHLNGGKWTLCSADGKPIGDSH